MLTAPRKSALCTSLYEAAARVNSFLRARQVPSRSHQTIARFHHPCIRALEMATRCSPAHEGSEHAGPIAADRKHDACSFHGNEYEAVRLAAGSVETRELGVIAESGVAAKTIVQDDDVDVTGTQECVEPAILFHLRHADKVQAGVERPRKVGLQHLVGARQRQPTQRLDGEAALVLLQGSSAASVEQSRQCLPTIRRQTDEQDASAASDA